MSTIALNLKMQVSYKKEVGTPLFPLKWHVNFYPFFFKVTCLSAVGFLVDPGK